MGRTEIVYAFSCGHPICTPCDEKMRSFLQHRCPTCRTARVGMSQEQADPPEDHSIVSDALRAIQGLGSLARRRNETVIFFQRESPIALRIDGSQRQEGEEGEEDENGSFDRQNRQNRLVIAVVERRSDAETQARLDEQARQAAAHDLVDALRNVDRVSMISFRERYRRMRRRPQTAPDTTNAAPE